MPSSSTAAIRATSSIEAFRCHGTARRGFVDFAEEDLEQRLQVVVANLYAPAMANALTMPHEFSRDGNRVQLRGGLIDQFLALGIRNRLQACF